MKTSINLQLENGQNTSKGQWWFYKKQHCTTIGVERLNLFYLNFRVIVSIIHETAEYNLHCPGQWRIQDLTFS